eukprot:gene18589-biopygen5527
MKPLIAFDFVPLGGTSLMYQWDYSQCMPGMPGMHARKQRHVPLDKLFRGGCGGYCSALDWDPFSMVVMLPDRAKKTHLWGLYFSALPGSTTYYREEFQKGMPTILN